MNRPEWPFLRRVFRLPLGRRGVRSEVNAELRFHIEGRIAELVARGMSHEDAEAEARHRFGDYARIETEVEDIDAGMARRRSVGDRLEALLADIRYAVRTLARQPLFSGVVILTLTLGIGATTAIFHVVDRVVLHPLPYPDPERVVYLGWQWAGGKGNVADALAPRDFLFWHDESRVFDGVAASRAFTATLGGGAAGATVQGLHVTEDFFRVLGTSPALGRSFSHDEFALGARDVVILGHALWMTHFGGDQSVIGRVIRLDERPFTVIGVMPSSFEVVGLTDWSELLTPLRFTEEQLADGGKNYTVMGRLRPKITDGQVAQDMTLVFDRFRAAFPELLEKSDLGVRVLTYREVYTGSLASVLWILLGATAFVLLLACANVANLLLARALSRQREFAVRSALGAGRGRIVRQLVVEVLVLGVVSAVIATVVSLASLHAILALSRGNLLRDTQLAVDPRAVFYTTLIALVASLGVGIAVALPATRLDLPRSLAEGGRGGAGARRQRFVRNALVTIESAISMLLLAGAGLLIASFARVRAVDPGFVRDGVVTAQVPHSPAGYDSPAAVWDFEQRVLARLHATPGIAGAGAASNLPLQRGWNLSMTIPGRPDKTEGAVEWRALSPGYLQTLGIMLEHGRDVSVADDGHAPPVVIVSHSFADHYWPGENPIGKRIWLGRYKGKLIGPGFDDPVREVVGVVADVRDFALDQPRLRHTAWVPQAQVSPALVALPAFAVRSRDVSLAATALRRAIAEADPRMPPPTISAMNDIVTTSLVYRRFSMVLMTIFAALALALTCVGIYGVVAYAVAQRQHEIGVRIALGAGRRSVVALVVGQGMRPVIVGLVVGLGASLSMSRLLAGMLYGVSPRDPLSLGTVAAVLAAIALVASYVPARRASGVDPLIALRSE